MRLIDRNLLKEFSLCLAKATQVDIAVAWATPCDALEALADSADNGTSIRIAVGISENVTVPSTLRRLQDFADLRIASPTTPHGIFHPKYYCFRGLDRTVCWIGSANLTRRGFGENNELVHEFDDSAKEGRHWFESLWRRLESNPGPAIDEYEERYSPPRRSPRPPPQGGAPEPGLLPNQAAWGDFVERLRARNDWYHHAESEWDVFGDTHSWLHTIAAGREVVRRPNWANLTKRECYILRGLDDRKEGYWGLLGSLKGAGRFARVFNPERMPDPDVSSIRKKLCNYVKQVLNSNYSYDDIAQKAHTAVQEIMENTEQFDGFGAAAATRLLTLARPDCLVSVNSQSAAGLGGLSELPTNPNPLAMRYEDLLNWVYNQPWFNSRRPDDPLERMIWNSRAALLDAFVYEGRNDV